jgi:hypothetical protein
MFQAAPHLPRVAGLTARNSGPLEPYTLSDSVEACLHTGKSAKSHLSIGSRKETIHSSIAVFGNADAGLSRFCFALLSSPSLSLACDVPFLPDAPVLYAS